MARRIPHCLLLTATVSLGVAPLAAENEQQANSGQLPSLELLEFLGQFETDQGEWMGPDSLMGEEFSQVLQIVQQEQNEPESTDSSDSAPPGGGQ